MKNINNILSREYPLVENYCKNSYYCGILQNLYAGSDGEIILFLQLNYQYNILKNFNNKIADALCEISFCDLRHQELLSQAIEKTYGNPIYATTEGKWISGKQVDYIKDTKQILHSNLEAKEKAIINYKIAISKIDNIQIKLLLSAILTDEENHRLILKKLLNSLEKM